MALEVSQVVSLAERPVGAPRVRRSHGLLLNSFDRRQFLRAVGAAGVGTGLVLLGWIPPVRRAIAGHQTYSIWDHCADIDYGGCYGCLQTDSDVDSGYCASNNWHRHDSVSSGGQTTDYAVRLESCTGNSAVYPGRNAWKWTVSGCCGSPARHSRRWRCSDGKFRTCISGSCGNWVNSVCPHQIDTGTAC